MCLTPYLSISDTLHRLVPVRRDYLGADRDLVPYTYSAIPTGCLYGFRPQKQAKTAVLRGKSTLARTINTWCTIRGTSVMTGSIKFDWRYGVAVDPESDVTTCATRVV